MAVTVAAIAVAVLASGIFLSRVAVVDAGVKGQAAAAARDIETRVSLVYHIGNEVKIRNDGSSPITVVKFILSNGESSACAGRTLEPGQMVSCTDPRFNGARSIAVVLQGGQVVLLKSQG